MAMSHDSIQYLSNSTKITTHTESAMLSMMTYKIQKYKNTKMMIVSEKENRKRRMRNPVMTSCSPTHPGCAITPCCTLPLPLHHDVVRFHCHYTMLYVTIAITPWCTFPLLLHHVVCYHYHYTMLYVTIAITPCCTLPLPLHHDVRYHCHYTMMYITIAITPWCTSTSHPHVIVNFAVQFVHKV